MFPPWWIVAHASHAGPLCHRVAWVCLRQTCSGRVENRSAHVSCLGGLAHAGCRPRGAMSSAASSASAPLPLGLSEPAELGLGGLFDDGDSKPDAKQGGALPACAGDGDDAGGQPSGKKGNCGRGKGKAKAAAAPKMKLCPYCNEMTDQWQGNKKCCRSCFPDYESAERDARRQNEKEYFDELRKDPVMMREFLNAWRREVPPRQGAGFRRGGFRFARFKATYMRKVGKRHSKRKVMKTRKQFLDRMVLLPSIPLMHLCVCSSCPLADGEPPEQVKRTMPKHR